jgi:hypothetical protein
MLPTTLPPTRWAADTFGGAVLGDVRRTDRLVDIAAASAQDPAASLPGQLADPAALKTTYRLLGADTDAVTFDAILAAHAAQTRQAATGGTVLLVQDTTTLDCSAHPATTALGPIGPSDHAHGLFLQTVLAVRPDDRLPLGVLGAAPFVRTRAPDGETRAARTTRDRESDIRGQLAEQVGSPPVGDMDPCRRPGRGLLHVLHRLPRSRGGFPGARRAEPAHHLTRRHAG